MPQSGIESPLLETPLAQTVITMQIVGTGLLATLIALATWNEACRANEPELTLQVDQRGVAAAVSRPMEEAELSRFKRQVLQSVSVTAGGLFEADADGIQHSFLDVGIGTGIPLGSFQNILGLTPSVRVDWIDAASRFDIPEELYEFELQFFYRRPITERLSWLAICSPSIRSDLTTNRNAFRVFALGLLNWERIPDRLTISAGAVALGRADLPVLPAVGILWTPTATTKLDLRFPLTRLSYRLSKQGRESETWAYVLGGIGGNTWAVTRRTGREDELSLRDYRLVAGWERLVDGGGGCFVECGVAMGRRLEYESDETELRLDDAAILQAGWRY